jgi:hypothetical protein
MERGDIEAQREARSIDRPFIVLSETKLQTPYTCLGSVLSSFVISLLY